MNIRTSLQAIFISFFVCFCGLNSQGKGDLFHPDKVKQFANYLFSEGDYIRAASEYERFLFYSGSFNDSILFRIGLCYQLLEHHDLALEVFDKILIHRERFQLDSIVHVARLYSLFRLERWEAIKSTQPVNDVEFYFYYYAKAMTHPCAIDTSIFARIKDDSLENGLRELSQKRLIFKKKSPLMAGVLSAFLPGFGKIYIGRIGDGLFSLAATSLTALISYQAFEEKRNLTGLTTAVIATSFYMGTIYGSRIGAEIHNERIFLDWKMELNKLNPIEQNPYWENWR